MLDIKLINENPSLVAERLKKKGYDVNFDEIIKKDAEKRALQFEIESLKAKRNKVSSEIPSLKKQGLPVEHIFEEMRKIGEQIAEGDAKINALNHQYQDVQQTYKFHDIYHLLVLIGERLRLRLPEYQPHQLL